MMWEIIGVLGVVATFLWLVEHYRTPIKASIKWLRDSIFKDCEQRLKEAEERWESTVMNIVKHEAGNPLAKKVCDSARKRH